jgi:lipopolysaccharide biosynthesis glycosyltransferase
LAHTFASPCLGYEPKARVATIFLGYSEKNKAYKLMKKHDKMIIISCDVIFEEMNNQVPIIDDTKNFILNPNFFKPHTNHSLIHINYTTHSSFNSCLSIFNLATYFSNNSTPWST